jgi:hypothetical protein
MADSKHTAVRAIYTTLRDSTMMGSGLRGSPAQAAITRTPNFPGTSSLDEAELGQAGGRETHDLQQDGTRVAHGRRSERLATQASPGEPAGSKELSTLSPQTLIVLGVCYHSSVSRITHCPCF